MLVFSGIGSVHTMSYMVGSFHPVIDHEGPYGE